MKHSYRFTTARQYLIERLTMDLYNKKGEQRPHNVISKMFDFLVFFSNHGTALVHVTYY